MSNTIKIRIHARAYQKIRNWVSMASGEVSGLGLVSEQKNAQGNIRQLIIDDVFLLNQECSGTETLLDDESIARLMIDLVKQGVDISRLKLWFHSHADMNVFWSQTDEQCILRLANSSYMVSIVTNKRKDILGRIDVYQPFHLTLNNIDTGILYPDDPELVEFCKKEFTAKVIEHPSPRIMQELNPLTSPFPGSETLVEAEIERLENMVALGKISVDEYQNRMSELMFQEEMFEI